MSGAVERACDEIVRRYQRAGFSLAAAQEQADRFNRSFNRVGDHEPERMTEGEFEATLDRVREAIG